MPFGPWELLLILGIVIIVFGVGKLPEVGGALGKGIKEFRKATSEEEPTVDSKEAESRESKEA
jgi:sec-independent protein translocase protein TatA